MTIKYEQAIGTTAGLAFCSDCNRHIGFIHKDLEPLNQEEFLTLSQGARIHDRLFNEKHTIRVIIYQREADL